jgi:AbrB family looped-hinge helix DNA binding protein
MQSSVTTKGQITLPAALRKRFGLGQGQKVSFAATADGILVKPVRIQDMTKEPAWRRNLQEAQAEARAGKGKFFASGEEFMDFLRKESEKADKLHRPSKKR